MKADLLIVGQGLAGSLLAWGFLDRGLRILVVDRDEETTSSKVAAGLVTPLSGPRFKLADGFADRLVAAKSFYWNVEEATSTRLFHHRKIARIFTSEKERAFWEKRVADRAEEYQSWHNPLKMDEEIFRMPHGGIEITGGGWLDVPQFLEATRQRLVECASYAIAKVNADDVEIQGNGIRWKNVEARAVVFCEGWRGNQNRFFDWLSMNPAAGEILDLKIPDLESEERIVNRGGWILPVGGKTFRAGSTYRRDISKTSESEPGKAEILEKTAQMIHAEPEVIGIKSAIRPIIRRSQIFMGRHPRYPQIGFFNGMGSKGVLNGPWYAERFIEYLLDDVSLPTESDLCSNLI